MEYTDREKKVIEILENVKSTYGDLDSLDELETDFILDIKEYKALLIGLDLLEKQRKELEMYKRIAEMDLKEGEEFKNEMCKHRCILKSDLEENYISKDKIREKIKELERYIYTGKNALQDFLQYRVKAKIQGYKELLGDE